MRWNDTGNVLVRELEQVLSDLFSIFPMSVIRDSHSNCLHAVTCGPLRKRCGYGRYGSDVNTR